MSALVVFARCAKWFGPQLVAPVIMPRSAHILHGRGRRMQLSTIASATPVLRCLDGFRATSVLVAGAKLDLFTKLVQHGPATAAQMAALLGSNVDATQRLLFACATLKLVDSEDGITFRANDTTSTYLSTTSSKHMLGYVRHTDNLLRPMWAKLTEAVVDGKNQWESTFNLSGEEVFKSLYSLPEQVKQFSAAMASFGVVSAPSVMRAFDLSKYRRLVDVGGSSGYMAVTAAQIYPELRATVFELPNVIPMTEAYIATQAGSAASRMSVASGSFFTDPIPKGDLMYLGRILHDWDEPAIITILKNVYASLEEGGAILLGEMLLDDDTGAMSAAMQSLNMLLQTKGKERTIAEYRQVLESIGFTDVRGVKTGAILDAIIATKPHSA